MADRYWVGGSGTWNTTSTTNWAATSGGPGGASVPSVTSDNVYFDANSSSGDYTVTVTTIVDFGTINIDNPVSGIVTFSGSSQFNIRSSITVSASAALSGCMSAYTGNMACTPLSTTAFNINTNGAIFGGSFTLGQFATTSTFNLLSALTVQGTVAVVSGTFNVNNYNITAATLSSSGSAARTINLGTSTLTLSTSLILDPPTNLNFNAGTSQINFSGTQPSVSGGGRTFYNVAFMSSVRSGGTITGQNTFNNFSVVGKTSTGVLAPVIFGADQTINGTLTLAAGAVATMRTFVYSDVMGATRTLTVNAFAADSADIDFRDIAIIGAASPISGTRFGDCKGNSGIIFPAAKTVYWRGPSFSSWGTGAQWSTSLDGDMLHSSFPLAQDTAIFSAEYPANGGSVYIGCNYNIGTIDMSARVTGNSMIFIMNGTSSYALYGDLTLGTAGIISYITPGLIAFSGRNLQKITSAGTGIQLGTGFFINSPGGTVRLEDALSMTSSVSGRVTLSSGTFDANGYNVTTGSFISSGSANRSVNIGSGTWILREAGTVWNTAVSTNLTITGSGTLSLISSSSKTFSGGGREYTRITLNQGGTGTLTVNGSNTFARLANTVIGPIAFAAGTTNTFTTLGINGTAGNLLALTSTSSSTQATLQKAGAWNIGANSLNIAGNTNLNLVGNNPNYISASYINGVSTAELTSKMFLGATNITSFNVGSVINPEIFYGSTKVF